MQPVKSVIASVTNHDISLSSKKAYKPEAEDGQD
jgi:hypothetical protein